MLGDHRLGWDWPTALGLAEGLSGQVRDPSSTQQFRGFGFLTVGWDFGASAASRFVAARWRVIIPSG